MCVCARGEWGVCGIQATAGDPNDQGESYRLHACMQINVYLFQAMYRYIDIDKHLAR